MSNIKEMDMLEMITCASLNFITNYLQENNFDFKGHFYDKNRNIGLSGTDVKELIITNSINKELSLLDSLDEYMNDSFLNKLKILSNNFLHSIEEKDPCIIVFLRQEDQSPYDFLSIEDNQTDFILNSVSGVIPPYQNMQAFTLKFMRVPNK